MLLRDFKVVDSALKHQEIERMIDELIRPTMLELGDISQDNGLPDMYRIMARLILEGTKKPLVSVTLPFEDKNIIKKEKK